MIKKQMKQTVLQYGGLLTALALLILVFSLRTDSFFQVGTARLIANQIPELTLLAVGMTLVLIIGQIDLSVGSVMALSGAVLGVLMAKHDWPLGLAILAGVEGSFPLRRRNPNTPTTNGVNTITQNGLMD